MEHKHWSMQWVRWTHSAVDYLAAAGGGDRVGGALVRGRGMVGVGVEGEFPIVLGALAAMEYVCLDLLVTGGGRGLGSEEVDRAFHLILITIAQQVC